MISTRGEIPRQYTWGDSAHQAPRTLGLRGPVGGGPWLGIRWRGLSRPWEAGILVTLLWRGAIYPKFASC